MAVAFLAACSDTDDAFEAPQRPAFIRFSFDGIDNQTALDAGTGFVSVQVPFGTDVTALKACFTATEGTVVRVDSVLQTSGEEAHDFSRPVRYTLTSGDGQTATWTVAVCYSDLPVV